MASGVAEAESESTHEAVTVKPNRLQTDIETDILLLLLLAVAASIISPIFTALLEREPSSPSKIVIATALVLFVHSTEISMVWLAGTVVCLGIIECMRCDPLRVPRLT